MRKLMDWQPAIARLRGPAGPPAQMSRRDWLVDTAIAVLVGMLIAARGASAPDTAVAEVSGSSRLIFVLVALGTALPLVVRRRYPLTAFWLVLLATHFGHRNTESDPTFAILACVVAMYSVAMYSAYQAIAISSGLFGAIVLLVDFRPGMSSVRPGILMVGFLVPMALAASTIRTWKQQIRAMEREQRAATQLAVEQERSRIAHDLHDVVTHNVSVMLVQAGAARKLIDSEPEVARESLLAVEAGGRAAMSELRNVMGLLTTRGEEGSAETLVLAPRPGLRQLPELVSRVRDAGANVVLETSGVATRLPEGIELAAYRVVQEGLTNTLKHAAGAQVTVRLDFLPATIRVGVLDTGGQALPSAGSGSGSGMTGLRERLAMYGGSLRAERTPQGGYSMMAEIPTETDTDTA